jgi:hypothetical protein
MSFRTRSVTLSDSTVLDMNMITLSSTCMLVWADDVAMLAHDDQRLPLRKCYTVAYADYPYWLKVRTPYATIVVVQLPHEYVECRVIPLSPLIQFDASLAGAALVCGGTTTQYPRSYWYRLLYGVGQTSRF